MKLINLLILFIFTTFAQAQVVLVTNKKSEINYLSKDAVKYLYLAKVNVINDIKINPLLSDDENLHKRFVNEVIEKDIHQYSSYWARLVFTGRKAIPRRLNKEEIHGALKNLNTIIYIEKKNMKNNWKIIYEE